jgi:hypothetical protein
MTVPINDLRLPLPLQEWIDRAYPDDPSSPTGGCPRQCLYVRDSLAPMLWMDRERRWGDPFPESKVISTHRSRSTILPVYELSRPDLGIRFVLRNNFFDWKLSVSLERPVDVDLRGLCETAPPPPPAQHNLVPVYFEGFPEDLVYPHYEVSDRRRWSAAFWCNEALWAAMFLLLRAARVIPPFETTQPERRADA